MVIRRTFDYDLVKAIITEPSVYRTLGDDSKPSPEDYWPVADDRLFYLVAFDGDRPLGLMMLIPRSAVHAEIHVAMLPAAWGKKSKEIGKAILRWTWDNTGFHRLTGNVQERNRLALAFGRAIGMEPFALNPASARINGQLENEIFVGITRPENL